MNKYFNVENIFIVGSVIAIVVFLLLLINHKKEDAE